MGQYRIRPISTTHLSAIIDHMPERHQALVVLAAGTGLRQGEIFGLTTDRLDLDERTVLVDRQLINVKGREPFFAPPKSEASVRSVPLPSIVIETLRVHLRQHPTTSLVFTNADGAPLRRSAFWTEWNRATRAAGVTGIRFHELRHYYASLLIRHGESIKTVQARLGHASASETSTPTATCGPTPTSEPVAPSTWFSELLPTICGPARRTESKTAGQRP